jgi:ribosome-binding factor A
VTQRTDRVDELLRQEITSLLARDVADPRIGFATVIDVETTADLAHARVWVSVIGQPEERRSTLTALEHAMPFIRRELGKRLRLRRIPEFSVRLDESIERGSRVMQLINELEAGATPDELPVGESLPTPSPRLPGDSIDFGAPIDEEEATQRTARPSGQRPGPRSGRRPQKHGAPRASGTRPNRGR